MPRAATAVATKTENWPRRNCARVASRWLWPMSPCRTWALRRWKAAPPASSSHSRFVAVNTMTRPPPATASSDAWPWRCDSSTEMMSSNRLARASLLRGTRTALCVTDVAACWAPSPTTSTNTWSVMKRFVIFRIQLGDVALKRHVWGRRASTSTTGAGASPSNSSKSKASSDRGAGVRPLPMPLALPAGHSPKMRSTSSAKPALV